MTPSRVIIVDDHPVFALGLSRLLEDEPWCQVVCTAGDGEAAMELAMRCRPDVVVDLRLPDCDGVELTRRLLDALPNLKVGILTMHADEEAVTRGMGAGATGYVLKDARPEEVVDAIRRVSDGGIVVSRGAAAAVRSRLGRRITSVDGLTDREMELLRLVSNGLDNAHIAQRLFLSPKTVRNRLSGLYAKLGVRSRAEAVALARNASIE